MPRLSLETPMQDHQGQAPLLQLALQAHPSKANKVLNNSNNLG